MMAPNDEEQEYFRQLLATRIAEVEKLITDAGGVEAIEPDKAIGRLSRLDAMQMQEMGKAQGRRRLQELQRLREGLDRLQKGVYGICLLCREPIARERLEYQPDACTCVRCAGNSR